MGEAYQTFTRRYRPQKFQEVVGQEAIVTTLKNAIRLKRSAHAYLFSGSRGIGKTTLARIFAKALNCPNRDEDTEPCNVCTSCKEINASRSMDVIEIDGASNRGIDDIRQINETISYAPVYGYKIYIIDEVHMLTKEAFNALLKTLEEPPASVKFFFATTESHKVLPTIISRCQRFDLTQISHEKIVQKLSAIAQECQREVDEEAFHLIARFSDGSLRDAESILDQIFCFEEGKITTEIIHQTLGATPYEYFFKLDEAIFEKKISFAFACIDALVKTGKDLFYFTEELIEHFRRLLLTKVGQSALMPLSSLLKEEYQKRAENYSQEELFSILENLMHALQTLQRSVFKRATLEYLLMEIIRIKERVQLPTLVRRLVELEKTLQNPSPKKVISNAPVEEKPDHPLPLRQEVKISQEPPQIPVEEKTVLPPPPPSQNVIAPQEKPQVVLEKIPFSLKEEKAPTEEKKEERIEIKKTPSQPKSRYDTLLRFASIELDGSLEMDPKRSN